MVESIKKLEECLVNEKIIKLIEIDKQFFKFMLEDGTNLLIGGDSNIRALGIVTDGEYDLSFDNLLIEEVDISYTASDIFNIVINDKIELSFETKNNSYIFISFGNTIECKIRT